MGRRKTDGFHAWSCCADNQPALSADIDSLRVLEFPGALAVPAEFQQVLSGGCELLHAAVFGIEDENIPLPVFRDACRKRKEIIFVSGLKFSDLLDELESDGRRFVFWLQVMDMSDPVFDLEAVGLFFLTRKEKSRSRKKEGPKNKISSIFRTHDKFILRAFKKSQFP